MNAKTALSPSRIPKVARKPGQGEGQASKTQARYLRDTATGALRSRSAPLTKHRDDVRMSWTRSAGLAMDLLQNSGRLKGAADQVLADTVGVGLTLSPAPDFSGMDWSEEEKTAFINDVKRQFRAFWLDPKECDVRGKLNGPKMVDIGLRHFMAFGEITGVFDFFDPHKRARYGITNGTKFLLMNPSRLVQDTNDYERLFQGVRHDENGRAEFYRFQTSFGTSQAKADYAAYDQDGRQMVLHVLDQMDADDVRGISPIAPAFRKHIQSEMLDDAQLQAAILQTIFAITLTSEAPSEDAYAALEVLKESEGGTGYAQEYLGYLASKLDGASESRISVGSDPQVNHLGPGEKLTMETPNVPGREQAAFSKHLARDMARAIGCTIGGLTMDYTDATYASTRMEVSSVWPIVMRRRERIAAPQCRAIYANWLDEAIGEGRVAFKGGYEAFRRRRAALSQSNWQGPAKPVADDGKAARASTERLQNGTSSIEHETGDLGIDPDQLFEQRFREHQRYLGAGMRSPYDPDSGRQVIQTEAAP